MKAIFDEGDPIELTLVVNGERRVLRVPPLRRLLDVLREDLRLTGSKEGCGEGECGACSVLMNGTIVNSCLIPAVQAQDADIQTVEAMAKTPVGAAVQEAFVAHGGAQCGICTPGMIMAAEALLRGNPRPDREQIKAALAGNLCRCTGYVKIIESVQAAYTSPP